MKRSIFVFLTLIFLSPSVFAVDYYWTRSGTSTPQIIDPVADCRALDPSSSYSYHSHSFAGATGQSMTCRFQRTSDGNLGGADYYYNRNGTTCQIDTTYNQSTGMCEGPQPTVCEGLSGTTVPFSFSGTAPDQHFALSPGGGYSGALSSSCFDECTAQVKTVSGCNFRSTGNYTCEGTAIYTGSDCNGTDVPGLPEPEPLPDPVDITDVKPCTYVTDAQGNQVCQSAQELNKEGKACGTVNGVFTCVSRPAEIQKTVIDTTVETVSNPDGTITEVKTDTATVTKCLQLVCTETTTVNTTTTQKGAGGEVTATSSTCTGGTCKGNTEGADGECLTAECSDEETALEIPDLDEAATFGESLTNFTDRIAAAPLLSSIASIGLNGSGSCSFPSASTMIGDISFNSICDNSDWLDPLFYVFLALWAFTAVRVLLSA
jgi:hypothetical protein